MQALNILGLIEYVPIPYLSDELLPFKLFYKVVKETNAALQWTLQVGIGYIQSGLMVGGIYKVVNLCDYE